MIIFNGIEVYANLKINEFIDDKNLFKCLYYLKKVSLIAHECLLLSNDWLYKISSFMIIQ